NATASCTASRPIASNSTPGAISASASPRSTVRRVIDPAPRITSRCPPRAAATGTASDPPAGGLPAASAAPGRGTAAHGFAASEPNAGPGFEMSGSQGEPDLRAGQRIVLQQDRLAVRRGPGGAVPGVAAPAQSLGIGDAL